MPQYVVRYYESASGDTPVEDFLNDPLLSRKARNKCLSYITLFQERGFYLSSDYLRKIATGPPAVWELRPEWAGVEYRLLFGKASGGEYLIVVAGKKRTSTAAFQNDIATAQRRLLE